MLIPRPEYPRPQFVRADWLCLNGPWQFEIDYGDSGLERGLYNAPTLAGEIIVPFCPESALSGVGHVDLMHVVWYRREVDIPAAWSGRSVLLHFGAVDYDATVWVNGQEVGRHRGGYTPFTCDLSDVAAPGETAVLTVLARDDNRQIRPRGKQSDTYGNHGCLYTRTTGIWQTVWLEPVARTHFNRPRITPDVANGLLRLELPLSGGRATGLRVRATLTDEQGVVCAVETAVADFAPRLDLPIAEDRRRLWSPDDPFLYGLRLELLDAGTVVDTVESYAGLRSVTIDGMAVKLNGRPVFQRLVLDQGFYPDGIYTAPTDEALRRDIELSMLAGFNGARLHQKVFEERFLYWADKLGYLVWGEFADWGCGGQGPERDHQRPTGTYITQWLEALERDYAHPRHHRLVPAQRDLAEHLRPPDRPRRGDPRHVPCDKGDGRLSPSPRYLRLQSPRARGGHLRRPRLRPKRRHLPRAPRRPRRRQTLSERVGRRRPLLHLLARPTLLRQRVRRHLVEPPRRR